MSAIGGYVVLDGSPAAREWIPAMAGALFRHGPDGVHHWCAGPTVLLHGQLATTPEALTEHQPTVDGSAQIGITFDGRLDNRDELLAWLRLREAVLDTTPDATLLLKLYQHEGDACVQRLVGDFAFAVWDARRRRLFCARSVVGLRPFHWHCDGRTFAFGTDAGVLLSLPSIPRRINEPIIGEILSHRFTHPTETLYRDVFRLRAGWALAVENGPPRVWRWHCGPFPEIELPSDEAYASRFRELFDQSLRACTRASTEVAAQLSGGLDSSSVVCRGAELFRAGALGRAPCAISAVFPGELQDESGWIEQVEAHLGASALKVTASAYDWEQAEDWSAQTLHLPLRPNTSGAYVAVCEQLKQAGIRVLLTGEGGDDWFTGTYAHWPDLLARGRWLRLLREGLALKPPRPVWRALLSIGANSLGPWLIPARRQRIQFPYQLLGPVPALIRPEWAARIALRERVPPREPLPGAHGLAQQQRAGRYDFARAHVNWENVLAYAASRRVEMRHPFHDRRLTEFAMGLPGDQLRRHGERKHILREAMRGTLPERVRTRQDKARFITPISDAIMRRLPRRSMADLICVREGWVDAEELARVWREHQAWIATQTSIANPIPLPASSLNSVWMAFSLDVWLRQAGGA